jgi:hypothetical protein
MSVQRATTIRARGHRIALGVYITGVVVFALSTTWQITRGAFFQPPDVLPNVAQAAGRPHTPPLALPTGRAMDNPTVTPIGGAPTLTAVGVADGH